MPDDIVAATRRVRTTMPLEIDGVTHPAGLEMDLPVADADTMVERRRAEHLGEPLKLTAAERATLPSLEPAEGEAELGMAVGERPDDAHPGEQIEAHGAEPVQAGPTPHEET